MTINNITVHKHKVLLGGTSDSHRKWAEVAKEILRVELRSIEIDTIDVYNMDGESYSFDAGSAKRLVIFGNATHNGGLTPKATIEHNGETVAHYYADYNELYIEVDVFKEYSDEQLTVFAHIVKEFERLVWLPKTYENSWKHTADREGLTQRFTDKLKREAERLLADDKRRARDYEQTIEDYKRNIKACFDKMIRLRNNIENEEANLANVGDKLIKDLDLIVNHPKVSDLQIKDDVFTVYVPNVHAYDKYDNKYYIGNMHFTMKPSNTEVKFYGDNPRRSYWTEQDPHPHVSGESHNACLGNVSSTIAELSSRMELYALTLTCIDFLENVNIDDAAGRRVENWDKIGESGEIIPPEPEVEMEECYEYEENYPVTEMNDAYEEMVDGVPTDHRRVCDDALDNRYHEEVDNEGNIVYIRD